VFHCLGAPTGALWCSLGMSPPQLDEDAGQPSSSHHAAVVANLRMLTAKRRLLPGYRALTTRELQVHPIQTRLA
jgi:hypothetical protein